MNDTQTSTADDRPSSFAEHFAAQAESASSPDAPESPASDASSASAAATGPQADGVAPTQADQAPPPGVPPEHRWPAILENARNEWKQQYGWAEQIDQQTFNDALGWYRRYQGDPIQFVQGLVAELQAHPTHGQALRSLAAKALAAGRGTAAVAEEPQPDLQYQREDGAVIRMYSAEQQSKREAWLRDQWLSSVRQEIAPVKETFETLQKREQAAQEQAEASQFASAFFADLQQLPRFKEHAKEIHQALASARLDSDHPAEVRAATLNAYARIVVPKLQSTGQQEAVAQLKQRAVAGQATVNPSRPAPSNGQRPRTFAELYEGRRRA